MIMELVSSGWRPLFDLAGKEKARPSSGLAFCCGSITK
jgi:hypothetical protein